MMVFDDVHCPHCSSATLCLVGGLILENYMRVMGFLGENQFRVLGSGFTVELGESGTTSITGLPRTNGPQVSVLA